MNLSYIHSTTKLQNYKTKFYSITNTPGLVYGVGGGEIKHNTAQLSLEPIIIS